MTVKETFDEQEMNERIDRINEVERLKSPLIKKTRIMKEKEQHYNNMLSMLQEAYRRLEHTDMISLRKQIKEVLTFKSE